MVSPLLVPVWVAVLVAPFRSRALRPFRFLSVAYLALAVLYLAGDGKAYYFASLYPILLAVGALPVASWTRPRVNPAVPSPVARGARTELLIGAVALSAGGWTAGRRDRPAVPHPCPSLMARAEPERH